MCGIIGFSGSKKDNVQAVYDADKIKFLMYYNSIKRTSTDSVGYYTPDMKVPLKMAWSAEDLMKYSWYGDNLSNPSRMFIGHVRNKSVGAISQDNAHPFQIKNIVGVHNGTIKNYTDLLKRYGMPYITGKTDSYYLYQCLVKSASPDPLKYIDGSAALLFCDIKKPDTLYVYRKDKPLYYAHIMDNMYISSEEAGLLIIGCKDIKQFKEDIFYKVVDGVITKEIDVKTRVLNKKTLHNIYFQRWLYCKTDTSELVKGNWYLACGTHFSNTGQVETFNLMGGITKKGVKLTVLKPLMNVDASSFDLEIDYTLDDTFVGRLVTCMQDIRVKDNTVAFERDSIVMITSTKEGKSGTLKLKDLTTEQSVLSVDYDCVRVCLPKEEQEYGKFLSTIGEELDQHDVEMIKFSTDLEAPINNKAVQIAEELLDKINKNKNLESMRESISTNLKNIVETSNA